MKTLPLSEVKVKLSQFICEVHSRDEQIIIRRPLSLASKEQMARERAD